MSFPWGATITGATSIIGGFLRRRAARKAEKRRIRQGLAAGVNPILLYGGSATPDAGLSPLGQGISSAGQAFGAALEGRRREEREDRQRQEEAAERRRERRQEQRLNLARLMLEDRRIGLQERLAQEATVTRQRALSELRRMGSYGRGGAGAAALVQIPGQWDVGSGEGRSRTISPEALQLEPPATYGEPGDMIYGLRNILADWSQRSGLADEIRRYYREGGIVSSPRTSRPDEWRPR